MAGEPTGGGGAANDGGRPAAVARGSDDADEPVGDGFATLSFLEPHKRFQNSVSVFQKRPHGWGEPVFTTYP